MGDPRQIRPAALPPALEPADAWDDGRPTLIEGVARVVELAGPIAWLEPEQTTSCGSCAASGACGAKGIGTVANRIAARRFPLRDHPGLHLGERVVVGVRPDALVKAALTAYAVPLVALLVGGSAAQSAGAGDGATLAGSLGGLAVGLLAARLGALRLAARGATAPRFLRRLAHSQTCEPL
jgi:sigma-E factor negative regulatory protein RseC